MIFLIIITFIAELIIVLSVSAKIIEIDRRVCMLSDEIALSQDEFADIMANMTQVTVDIRDFISVLKEQVIKYRNKFLISQLKSVLQTLILFCFKPKYRKLMLSLKFISKFIKKITKKLYMLQ